MRLLVTGGRDYKDEGRLIKELEGIDYRNCIDVLIFGDCPTGVDMMTERWARRRDVPFWKFQANWVEYGDAAGPIRNSQMISEGAPTHCVAFPTGGPGTADCVKKARDAGLPVMEIK